MAICGEEKRRGRTRGVGLRPATRIGRGKGGRRSHYRHMLFLILLFYVLAPYIRSFSLFRPRKKRRKRRGQFGHRSLYRFYRIRAKKKDGGKKRHVRVLQVSRPRKPGSGRSQSCPSLSLCSDVVTCGRSQWEGDAESNHSSFICP